MYFKEGSNVSLAEYSNIGPGLKLLRFSYLNIRLAYLSLSYNFIFDTNKGNYIKIRIKVI